MKDFWNYSKAKALDYVNNAIHEIQGPLPIPGQAHYYSLKINASAEKVLERLQQLKSNLKILMTAWQDKKKDSRESFSWIANENLLEA